MKLEQILEAPFTDQQEQRFLTALRKDVGKRGEWPQPRRMTSLVKSASPKAKKVGTGAYSQAYGRTRSNVVIKISHSSDGEDTLKFLRWAKTKKNPHLPRIYSIKKTTIKNEFDPYDSFYTNQEIYAYARMERLVPLNPKKYNWKPEHVPFLEWMYQQGYAYPEEFISNWDELKLKTQKKNVKTSKLHQTIISLSKIADDGELDIMLSRYSAHNIMLRPGTNEIVIHDPF